MNAGKGISYAEAEREIRRLAGRRGLPVEEYGVAEYPGKAARLLSAFGLKAKGVPRYNLLRVTYEPADPEAPLIEIDATWHGEEAAGTISCIERFDDIFDYAAWTGVGVIMHPCLNPSGFDRRKRYNELGQEGNNCMLVYAADGKLADELKEGEEFDRWLWAADGMRIGKMKLALPEETLLMQEEARRLPFNRIKAALDLHQDHWMAKSGAYAYVFGDGAPYLPILRKVGELGIPILANEPIDSTDWRSENPQGALRTDGAGFVRLHDGSLQDLFDRQGVPYTATFETSGEVPTEKAVEANLIWIEGMMDLAAAAEPSGRH